MAANSAYVIVGASLAGAEAAQTLREEGADEPIVLIGEESERPYERPPLSKAYLLGTAERETIYVHPQAWYSEHDIDLRLGVAVTSVDPTGHEVTLADGSHAGYSKLLLTTGSSPRRLPTRPAELGGSLFAPGRSLRPAQGNPSNRVPGRGDRRRLDRPGGHGGSPRRWG
jgi:3-phenylpropionate/trans-cinnamate dioxygenase ferredoxin reductase subunit